MKKKWIVTLSGLLAVSSAILGSTEPAIGVTKLKAVTFLPTNIGSVRYMAILADRVKERSNGQLIIDLLGGPEAVARRDQPEALRNGVVHMGLIAGAETSPYVPESNALLVSEITPMEERARGFIDFMNERYNKKMNAHVLGRARSWGSITLYLRFKVNTLEDLKGKAICSTPGSWKESLEHLGANPLVLPLQERYSALERGVADGSITSFSGAVGSAFPEVTKYFIEPTIHPANNLVFVINLDAWNGLPENLRKLMMDVVVEIEKEQYDYFQKDDEVARQKLIAAGMQPTVLAGEEAKRWIEAWNGVVWDKLKRETTPESFSKARTLILK